MFCSNFDEENYDKTVFSEEGKRPIMACNPSDTLMTSLRKAQNNSHTDMLLLLSIATRNLVYQYIVF